MSQEQLWLNPMLEELGNISPEFIPSYVEIKGKNTSTNYDYTFGFIFEHPQGPYIRICTKPRSVFLTEGSEQQAQDALVDLAHQTKRRSGGCLNIHPFHGAVWGTKLTPVAPGFLTDLKSLDEGLTMMIFLTNATDRFDEQLTKEALEIGTIVTFPGTKARRLLEYMQTPKINPNQQNRDIAIANNFGERWDEEFREFNRFETNQPVMVLSPSNIVVLMRGLEEDAGLTNLAVANIYFKR